MLVESIPAEESGIFPQAIASEPGARTDLMALRQALRGSSVVDMSRVYFESRMAADNFLRLHQFDTDNPLDLKALSTLHIEAVEYLSDGLGVELGTQLETLTDVHELFLLASNGVGVTRRRACTLLKVMHIQHHLNCRELVFNMPISEAELFNRLNNKVFAVIDNMRAAGIGVVEFASGQKTRHSRVTKLLAKKASLATHLYDKLRFRLVLASREDLVLALVYFTRHAIPFNFIMPGQSQNGLIGVDDVSRVLQLPVHEVKHYFRDLAPDRDSSPPTPVNEFSGSTYRCVNFVADIPLRLDDVAPSAPPAIAVVQAEFQLFDEEAVAHNERGENAHRLYKDRQLVHVRRRLEGARLVKGKALS